MSRFLAICAAISFDGLLAEPSRAADSIALRDTAELREALDRQSKQLEALTQQVARLSQIVEGQKGGAVAAVPALSEPAKTAEPAPEAFNPDTIPKAEAVPAAPKHVVAKGETLTSIAKHYNIAISDLQKTNKIENDRKLQIGQTLTLPSVKPPDTAAEKKEKP